MNIRLQNDSVGSYINSDNGSGLLEVDIEDDKDVYNQKNVFKTAYATIDAILSENDRFKEFKDKLQNSTLLVLIKDIDSTNSDAVEQIFLDINEKSKRLDNASIFKGYEEVAEVMEKADELSKWASDVMAYAQAEAIENGKHWNGYKLVEGRSTRRFIDEKKVEEAAKGAGYTDIYNKSLITLTAFEKLMGKDTFKEVLGSYVTKPAGKLTLVPVSDKRPEVTVNTVNDEFQED